MIFCDIFSLEREVGDEASRTLKKTMATQMDSTFGSVGDAVSALKELYPEINH
tara:strand:+ start:3701 stop:3859 length:159 start_codon:yes stop_codon:yes gene_type:complete